MSAMIDISHSFIMCNYYKYIWLAFTMLTMLFSGITNIFHLTGKNLNISSYLNNQNYEQRFKIKNKKCHSKEDHGPEQRVLKLKKNA